MANDTGSVGFFAAKYWKKRRRAAEKNRAHRQGGELTFAALESARCMRLAAHLQQEEFARATGLDSCCPIPRRYR